MSQGALEPIGRWVYPPGVTSYPQLSPPALLGLATDMIVKDWQPVWCLQRQSGSYTPLPGTTGGSAPFPSVEPQPTAAHRLAFRPPHNVVILDVDHYDDKTGALTMDKAEAWLGDLPPTYKVTSRGEGNPSGRYLYRKPGDLDFTDSALNQFADEDGHTSVEIVRTGHRFSWAPGDVNHKTGQTVKCYDPLGDECSLPYVSELPELPERWVEYLYNPPTPQNTAAYTRPSDGPEWWLSQADESLGSRAELAQFAFDLLASRLMPEQALVQLRRVCRADVPGQPWEEQHLVGLVDANTERKVAEVIERDEIEHAIMSGISGGDDSLQRKYEAAQEAYENKQVFRSEFEVPFSQKVIDEGMQQAGIVVHAEAAKTTADHIRALPDWDRLLFQELARTQAKKDAAKILAGSFDGYESIADLPEPPPAQMLFITGSDGANPLIPPCTITSLSGPRASGKSWVAATWAAQEMTQGHYVFWVDFERQAALFNRKLRQLGVQRHILIDQLKYTAVLPPPDRLIRDIAAASQHGYKRVLLIVDAFRGLQAVVAPGTSATDGDAVEAVYMEYLNPAVEAGATVCLLDHLPKAGGATFGSERKESAPDYVVKVEQLKAFTKTSEGFSSLTVTKDRYGEIEADSVVGYLWMPGESGPGGESIKDYPRRPEFRSWAPVEEGMLEGIGVSEEAQKEVAIMETVRDNPLRFGPRELGRHIMDVYPALFKSDRAAQSFADRMVNVKQMLDKDDGKYILPVPREVHEPAITAAMLEHPESRSEA